MGQLNRDKGENGGGQWRCLLCPCFHIPPFRETKLSDNDYSLAVGQSKTLGRRSSRGKESTTWPLQLRKRTMLRTLSALYLKSPHGSVKDIHTLI